MFSRHRSGGAPCSIIVAVVRKFVLLLPLIYVMPLLVSNKTMGVYLAEPVAGFAFYHPELLAASTNPTVAILCIIGGIITAIPLLVALAIGLSNVLNIGKKKNIKGEKK